MTEARDSLRCERILHLPLLFHSPVQDVQPNDERTSTP